jgi:hypothetical protein
VEQSTRQAFDMTWGTMAWLQRHRAGHHVLSNPVCPILCNWRCVLLS